MYTSISVAKFMQNNEKLYINIQILTKSTFIQKYKSMR